VELLVALALAYTQAYLLLQYLNNYIEKLHNNKFQLLLKSDAVQDLT
jgi:hypothetical protein